MNDSPIFCAKCANILTPGSGDHYVVHILCVADPAPPIIESSLSAEELRREIQRLYRQLENVSPHEASQQVFREIIQHLCLNCYKLWVENPFC